MTKKIFSEFLFFRTRRTIVVNFGLIMIALAAIPTAFYGPVGQVCIWHQVILPLIYRGRCPTNGIFYDCRCPGCGMTHALSRFFHGDISGAYQYNRLIFPFLAVAFTIFFWNLFLWIKKSDRV